MVPKAFGIRTDQLYDESCLMALIIVGNYSRKCSEIYAGKYLKVSNVVGVIDNLVTSISVYPQHIKVDNESEFINKVFNNKFESLK